MTDVDIGGAVDARYGRVASDYQRHWAPHLRAAADGLLDELPLTRARAVLDVACGVGALLPELRRRAPTARIIGVDRTAAMLRLAPVGDGRVLTDARRLALASDRFDVATMTYALFHLDDPVDGLREMARVVRPGGTVGVITWGPDRDVWRPATIVDEELDRLGAPPEEPPIARHDLVDSDAKLAALARAAGLTPVRTWVGPFGARYAATTYLDIKIAVGRTRGRFESLASDARAEFLRRAERRLGELTPEQLADPATLVFLIAAT